MESCGLGNEQAPVSVLLLAYNHEPYIEESIQGILNQVFDGGIELLIGEDASSDQTLKICLKYQSRYPQLIRVLTDEKNVGMHANFRRLWEAARYPYVAFCEGDDYWSDPYKLQKQVSFLRQHPECSMCGTYTQKVAADEQGIWKPVGILRPSVIRETYAFADLIPEYTFHFSSILLLKNAVTFPDWLQSVYCVDRPLYLLATQAGKRAGLIPEITSVYRLHSGGNWSAISLEKKARNGTDLFHKMREFFEKEYRDLFNQTLSHILFYYLSEALQRKEFSLARKLYWQSIAHGKFCCSPAESKRRLKVLLRLYLLRR